MLNNELRKFQYLLPQDTFQRFRLLLTLERSRMVRWYKVWTCPVDSTPRAAPGKWSQEAGKGPRIRNPANVALREPLQGGIRERL